MGFFEIIALATLAAVLVHGRVAWMREWFLVVIFAMALMYLSDIDFMYRRMLRSPLDPSAYDECARRYAIGWNAAAARMAREQAESTSKIRMILCACFVTLVGGWLAEWYRAARRPRAVTK